MSSLALMILSQLPPNVASSFCFVRLDVEPMLSSRLPCVFVSHGGGPLFFVDSLSVPPSMRALARDGEVHRALMRVPQQLQLSRPPRAIVVVTAHWQTKEAVGVSAVSGRKLLYDYGGFPAAAYALTYDAPADTALSDDIVRRLQDSGQPAKVDKNRGFDHGVFVPLRVLFPAADIPVVAVSILSGYDSGRHINMGKALAALRDDNVLIIGSGFITHERDGRRQHITEFLSALSAALSAPPPQRTQSLLSWKSLPYAAEAHRFGHEDHLMPLLVVLGAAGADRAEELSQTVFGTDDATMAAANIAFGLTRAAHKDLL